MRHLILGGQKSGKSRIAEQCAANSGLDVIYIATARAGDEEMHERIERHKGARPDHWRTMEIPIQLGRTLAEISQPSNLILIDCLTLWMTNLYSELDSADRQREMDSFLGSIASVSSLIMVSNEINMGVISMSRETRAFCDSLGLLHQQVAEICERVTLVIAGVPMPVKSA